MRFDSKSAAEYGRLGGLAKARNKREQEARDAGKTPEDFARERLFSRVVEVADNLVAAALGEGKYGDLPKEKQLQALFRCADYLFGRATALPKQEPTAPAGISEGPGLSISQDTTSDE